MTIERYADVDELAAELLPLTTMNDVFRGSLTGSFSRQMILAAAAQARAASEPPKSPPPRGERWRRALGSVRPVLPALRWEARWRSLLEAWDERVAPGGPTLRQALAVAGSALLVGLGYAWLGPIRLRPPPPGLRAAATSEVSAALAPAPAPVAELPSAPEVLAPQLPPAPELPEAVVAPSTRETGHAPRVGGKRAVSDRATRKPKSSSPKRTSGARRAESR